MTDSVAARFRMDGRVAIVTGASKGIGEATARALAEAGARVVVSSRRQEAVDAVAHAIVAAGGEALAVAANVGRPDEARALVERTLAHWGGVDVVVNNAAVNPVYGPLLDADDAVLDKILAVNVKGPLEVCRHAYPSMRARGRGSVVNVSSIGGVSPEPGLGLYSVSKAALVSLTKVMAQEWGAHGVRANVICPGLIRTKFSQALWQDERVLAHTLAQQPIPRVGEPEDVAGLALFLASDAAAYCTGGVYMADGGYLT
ncbi:glucose 1-dehydrogenase [Roseisolibacter sp. H3M3-2]|uniref:SDR family NAD(P)-dependent oxidoreductase n=1 Tax=Roseisolibacter sp. H3M3-2 TaxID=3031323 RepID=UPI0023DC6FFB|nr:glucose 1-dehydrogenase [Roseisolibacter sp. H3M3-2]MDF1501935.1 glucose 1-dehydrogenase [Roseisolibacter sp. H3M3-2]